MSNTKQKNRKKKTGTAERQDVNLIPDLIIKDTAEMGRESFFYFVKEIMAFKDIEDAEMEYWCERLQELPNLPRGKRKLLLIAAKDTFKTSICTIAFPLWLMIQNSEYWGRNLTSFIGNGNPDKAQGYIQEIRETLKKKEKFKACYGEFQELSDEWTKKKLTVERDIASKDATFQAISVKTPLSSAHPKLIIIDDWSNEKNSITPVGRAEVINSFKDAIGTLDKEGIIIILGHRFHYKDIFYHLTEDKENLDRETWKSCLIFAPDRKGGLDNGVPNFPKRLPNDVLENKRRDLGVTKYKAYYRLDPSAMKGSKFKLKWLERKYITLKDVPPDAIYIAGVDLCTGVNSEDPSTDYFAMDLVAMDPRTRNGYLMEMVRGKYEFPAQVTKVKHYYKMWKHQYGLERVFIESVQMQVAMPQMLKIDPEARGMLWTEIKTNKNKEMRLDGLSVVFEKGCIYINSEMAGLEDFLNEYMEYPSSDHDDQLDVLDLTTVNGWDIIDQVMEDRNDKGADISVGGKRETYRE